MEHRTTAVIALACVFTPTLCLAAGISTSRSNIRTRGQFSSPGGSADFSIVASGGTGLLADLDPDRDGVFTPLPDSFLTVGVSPVPPGQIAGTNTLHLISGGFDSGSMGLRGVGSTNKLSFASVSATSSLTTTVQNQVVGGSAQWTQTNDVANGVYQTDGVQQSRAAIVQAKSASMIYDPYVFTVAPGAVGASALFTVDLTDIEISFAPGAGESGTTGLFAHARFGIGSTPGIATLSEGDYALTMNTAGSTTLASAAVFSQSFSLTAGQTYWFDMYSATYTSVVPEPGTVGVMSLLGLASCARRKRRASDR